MVNQSSLNNQFSFLNLQAKLDLSSLHLKEPIKQTVAMLVVVAKVYSLITQFSIIDLQVELLVLQSFVFLISNVNDRLLSKTCTS